MEQYGGVHDGKPSDPSPEWTTAGEETGLEEPVWQLGLGNGGGGVSGAGAGGGGGRELYPERPEEADCIHYMRTGFCRHGATCRFNHPRSRFQVFGAAGAHDGEYPERAGQPFCRYYMRTGTCKFGASCKYNHPKQAAGSPSLVTLNYFGYPLRPGEKECSYYIKRRECKFGMTCKFHHPQPDGIHIPTPSLPQVTPSPASVAMHALYPPSPSQAVPSPQQYGVMVPRPSMLPSYVQSPNVPLLVTPSMVSYPGWSLYQGPPPCMHYLRGECKFGAACKFDHSMGALTYNPSASSFAEMPVVPYPVGFPVGTLAPFVSTSSKDSTSMGMNTSMVSSGSVPSVTIHKSRSSSQLSGQTTGTSAGEESRNIS